jgi:hypothetical protein
VYSDNGIIATFGLTLIVEVIRLKTEEVREIPENVK